jgi:hypothetical protein
MLFSAPSDGGIIPAKSESALHVATTISPDGRYIAGQGFNAATRRPEAFLLDTVPNLRA